MRSVTQDFCRITLPDSLLHTGGLSFGKPPQGSRLVMVPERMKHGKDKFHFLSNYECSVGVAGLLARAVNLPAGAFIRSAPSFIARLCVVGYTTLSKTPKERIYPWLRRRYMDATLRWLDSGLDFSRFIKPDRCLIHVLCNGYGHVPVWQGKQCGMPFICPFCRMRQIAKVTKALFRVFQRHKKQGGLYVTTAREVVPFTSSKECQAAHELIQAGKATSCFSVSAGVLGSASVYTVEASDRKDEGILVRATFVLSTKPLKDKRLCRFKDPDQITQIRTAGTIVFLRLVCKLLRWQKRPTGLSPVALANLAAYWPRSARTIFLAGTCHRRVYDTVYANKDDQHDRDECDK